MNELNIEKNKLFKINNLPFIINDGCCIKKHDKIYIIGGNIDFVKFTNQILIYDLKKNEIEEKHYNLLECRHKFASVLYENKIYCFGGNNETNMEIIDLDTMDIKLHKKFLPFKLFRTKATIIDENIYIVGGGSTFSPLPNLYSYNINNNILLRLNNMHFPRNSHEMITINNIIYVIGGIGISITNSVESYNILNGKWEILKSMHIPRYSHKVIFNKGFIMVFGGISNKPGILQTEYYDIEKNQWYLSKNSIDIDNYSMICSKNI